MRTFKKIVTYICALILAISIVLCTIVFLLSSTILDKNYVLEKLEETDYYAQIYELVESNFENYIQQSGLDETVIDNLITVEKVKEDTEQILINLYDGLNGEISTQEIEDNLNANITASLGDRVLTSDEEESVATFVETICSEYENTILHTKYEEQINDYYQKITEYVKIAKQILCIAIGIALILLIVLNNKAIYRTIKGIAVALLSSGILLVIINYYINSNIKIQSIIVLNEPFSEVLVNVLEEIMNNILVFGWISIIVGIVLIIGSNLLHNIRKYGLE